VSEDTSPPVALHSENELCRKCGGPLRRGTVEGESGGFEPASIAWMPAVPDTNRSPYPEYEELAPVPLWGWSKSPRFPALLCPNCKIVEIHYGSEAPATAPLRSESDPDDQGSASQSDRG
jgi:hypothetical protein